MIKWSRVKLYFTIITAAGLLETLRERISIAPLPSARPRTRPDIGGETPHYIDLAGAFHVHSNYSDGAGTVDDIVEAARRAEADVVLICDHSTLAAQIHGEGGWRSDGDVLVVVGTEVATERGHLLLLDIPSDTEIEAGDSQELMERVTQKGGYGYIALPCDLKDHWRDFSVRMDGFGLEVFNLSSIARAKINIPGLILTLARYRGKRPISAFSYVASRPKTELRLWDQLSVDALRAGRPIPSAIGCLDAHAVMRFGGKEYPFPTYEEVFRTCRTHVLVEDRPARTADSSEQDTIAFHNALRAGRSYVSYDNFGDPRGFRFEVKAEGETIAGIGDTLQLNPTRRATIEVRSPRRRSLIKLLRNGNIICRSRSHSLSWTLRTPGIYRTEIESYGARVGPVCFGVHPWIFSNPIVVSPSL